MPDDWLILSAQARDARALAAFAQASFAETFAFRNYPAADLATFFDEAMSADVYAAQIADSAYRLHLGVDSAGQIAGFIKIGPVYSPLPHQENGSAGIELHQLYVARRAHGTGLADALMARLWAHAADIVAHAAYLSVYCENIRAQRFYARHGFAEIGASPFAVGNTIDDDRIWKAPVPR